MERKKGGVMVAVVEVCGKGREKGSTFLARRLLTYCSRCCYCCFGFRFFPPLTCLLCCGGGDG